jgi:bifunctional DNA-binding transcriptional regulator/antitoxin component of YhaV-PrlF toxin-antitoxin module
MSLTHGHPTRTSKLDRRNAFMQHCSMTTLTMTKRGAITIPPDIRKRMGLDRLEHPLLIAEERDGGLFIQPAMATPIRDIPLEKIQAWLKEDEEAMNELRGTGPV